MKILHIFPYSPIPPTFGGALRIYNLIKQMCKNNEVTLLTFGDEIIKTQLKQTFSAVAKEIYTCDTPIYRRKKRILQIYSLFLNRSFFSFVGNQKQMQAIINKLTLENHYDIVQFEFPHIAQYQINSDSIKLMDAHNVEYMIYYHQWKYAHSIIRKFFYEVEYKKLYNDEISTIKKQDALLVTSENDKMIFDKLIPNVPKYIIPNGVDTEYFHSSDQEPEPKTLVFTGALSYLPNSDAMIYFIDEILPFVKKEIPDIKIYIIGKNPPQRLIDKSNENVIITGYVDDVRPYVWKSSIFIVPLRMGSGTRLKILEAFSMKKPVVSTSIGAEGLDIINEETALIADEPKEFAANIIRLIKDKQLQKKLTTNAYELIINTYDWNIIGTKLDQTYKELYDYYHKNNQKEFKTILK